MSDDTTIYAMSPYGGKRVHRMATNPPLRFDGQNRLRHGVTLCGRDVYLWRVASHNHIAANGVCALCTRAAIRLNRERR